MPLRARLAAFLRERRLLLILDNVEHLLETAPLVSDLLTQAPGSTVLATSRTRLRLQGEREVVVSPLVTPDANHPSTKPEEVGTYEAVRLFVARAQEAKPGFTLTAENAAVVAEICARLDGLPLALELAAARIKLLPLPTLLGRLERRLPLLTGGAPDLPTRQQTLRATIAWSHDLLTPEEQALLRRLSVFAGGWTLEAAEAVTDPAGELGLDTLEGLGALVDASLVQPVEVPEGEPRFRMLETVREFGLERLIESGEEAAVRDRHATWFLHRAEQEWAPEMWGAREMNQAEAEYPNLRTALAWLLDQRPEDALRLASSLTLFWWERGQLREASDWLHQALAKGAAAGGDVRATALAAAARLAYAQGEADKAVRLSEESLALWDSLGEDARASSHYAIALFERGASAYWAGSMEVAEHAYLLALERFKALRMPKWEAATSAVYGGLSFDRGDLDRSEELHRNALAVAQAEQHAFATAFALSGLADVALARGDVELAGGLWLQSLDLAWQSGEVIVTTLSFVGLADVAAHQGNAALAVQLLGADQVRREASGLALEGRRAWYDHACAVARASLGAEGFQRAWDEGRTWSLERAVTEAQAITTSAVPGASTDPNLSPA